MLNWNKDPEFQQLPDEQKSVIYQNYFDQELSDNEFRSLPDSKQNEIKSNFLTEQGSSFTPIATEEPLIEQPLISIDIPEQKQQEYTDYPNEFTDVKTDYSVQDVQEPIITRENLQGVKEIISNVAVGAASFIPAGLISHATTAIQSGLEKTGIFPKEFNMSDKDKKELREKLQYGAATLGRTIEPKTEVGQQGMEKIGKLLEPISEFVHSKTRFIDEKKYPNLRDFADFTGEVIAFGAFGHSVRRVPKIVKAVKQSNMYRKATIKERGMVIQSMEEVLKRNPKMSKGEAARLFDEIYQTEFKARSVGEGAEPQKPKPSEIVPEQDLVTKPTKDNSTGGMTIDQINSIPDPVVRAFAEGRMSVEKPKEIPKQIEGKVKEDKKGSFEKTKTGKLIGYKVMAVDEKGQLQSGADSRQRFKLKNDSEITMPDGGVFLSNNQKYVEDYYSGLAENEVVLKLEFDEKDIISGKSQLFDKEPEIGVSNVKIISSTKIGGTFEKPQNPSPPKTEQKAKEPWNKQEDGTYIVSRSNEHLFRDKFDNDPSKPTGMYEYDGMTVIFTPKEVMRKKAKERGKTPEGKIQKLNHELQNKHISKVRQNAAEIRDDLPKNLTKKELIKIVVDDYKNSLKTKPDKPKEPINKVYTIDRNQTGKTMKRQKATLVEAIDEAIGNVPVKDVNDADIVTFEDQGRFKKLIITDGVLAKKRISKDVILKYVIAKDRNKDLWQFIEERGSINPKVIKSFSKLQDAKKYTEAYFNGDLREDGIITFKNKNGKQTYETRIPNSRYHLRNYRDKVSKSKGVQYASTGAFADIPVQAMEMPEIVKLARELLEGKYPRIKTIIGRKLGVLGRFTGSKLDTNIDLKAELFKDVRQASKTLAHEIGHLVDFLDDKTMARGNILGRIASLKKYMKRTMESKPGRGGELTDTDRKRLKKEARKLLKEDSGRWIDEIIIKETPVSPQNILDIWNSVEGSLNKNLTDYIKKLSSAEKKAIVKAALKGKVLDAVKHFSTKEEIKTGKKIKLPRSKGDIEKVYKDLIEKELEKRKLLIWEEIQTELKDFTQKWKPFDPNINAKFTKYRLSSPELYADALSAIITNPGYIKEQAPKFFKAFYDFLGNKPMVKDIYAEIMSTVNKTDKAKAMEHIDDIYKMFQRSTKKRNTAIQKSKIEPVSAFDQLATSLWDQSHEALKAIRVMEKIPGVIGKDAKNARMAIQELQHTSTVTGVYLADFNTNVLNLLDKAGYTLDDLGVVGFLDRIAKGDRSDKANPLGIDQSVAERDLSIIGKELWGAEKYNKIKGFLGKYRTLRTSELYPVIRESAILNLKMMDYIEKNTHHVKWDVAAYFDKTIGGGKGTAKIYKQVGTLNEIDNPIVSTVLQDISLLRASLINLVKQDLVAALKNGGLVEPAKLKYSLDAKTRIPKPPEKGQGILTVFETSEPGKPHHYYVSKDIAEMFEYNDIQAYQLYSLWFGVSRVAKEMMVGKNPAWMLRNLDRDFKGTIKNVPGIRLRHIPEIVKTYISVIPEVYQEAYKRKSSERIRAMKKARGLPQYRMWSSKDVTFDNEISRQLTEFKILPDSASKASRIPKVFRKVWDFLDNTGYASEIWGKVAADKYLNKKGREPKTRERARITRELAGTPDSKQRSKYHRVLNSIALFSEMRKAGLRQMSTAYKADKSGYIWKTFMMNVLPKVMKHFMLVNGAVFGIQAINKLFEDDEKKKKKAKGYLKELSQAYVRIPSYDQEHYQCIPLGLTSTGKAAYLRIPMDYEGQIFGTIGYLTAKEIMNQIDNNGDLPETYKKLAKTVSEQTPYNWHPIITTARDLITYTMGDSPTDWKGYDVIPKNITNTGGETYLKESAPYIWRHLLSNFGVRNFVDLGHGDLEVDKEWYESILKQPGLSALGSYLKFSDRGLQEKIQRKWDKAKEQKAEISLDRYKGVINLANGEVVTLKQAVAMAMNPGTTKKQFLKAINIKRGSVYAKMLSRAKSKEEKTIVLMTILEQEK